MITPTPGVVYKFYFRGGFTDFNGTYRLVQVMTYDEYVKENHDIVADFFVPCGKTAEDALADLETIRTSQIMKLRTIDELDTGTEKYAPMAYMDKNPDHNVKKYSKLGVVAYIGIVDEVETLDYINNNLREQFTAGLGIDPQPQFMSTGEVYLTDDEYKEEVAKRNESARQIINYFSENRRLEKVISQQKTRLEAYEATIAALVKKLRSDTSD